MTTNEILQSSYAWASANAGLIFLLAIALPLLGAGAAKLGKGGKTDADGRLVASVVIGSGIVLFVLEVALMGFARAVLKKDVLDANTLLLLAPVVYIGLGIATIRWVFPLSELGSVRQAVDIAAFVLVCWAIFWLFGKFHWGVIFFGSLVQLLLILAVGAVVVHRLYQRVIK